MNPQENSDPLALVDEQAALWAGRLAGSELAAAERRELATWLAQDARHRAVLSDYVALARDSERLMPMLAAAGRVEVPAPSASAVSPWRIPLAWGAVLAAAAVIAVMFFLPRPEVLATAPGAVASHQLADGSQVDLNARTVLEIDFARDTRHVRLARGEALFAVAKDPQRPFIVETTAGTIRVTGTRFNVRLEADDIVEITVLEGSVAVTATGAHTVPQKLSPGDRLVVSGGKFDLRRVPLEELQDAIAWLQGRVILNDMPLREAAARYAHYHDRRIEVDPAVALKGVGGAYRISDLAGFLKAVAATEGVKVTTDADGVIRIGPR